MIPSEDVWGLLRVNVLRGRRFDLGRAPSASVVTERVLALAVTIHSIRWQYSARRFRYSSVNIWLHKIWLAKFATL